MARRRLPQQQDLLSNLLTITHVREEVELLLEHVIRLQSQTISLAAASGINQTDLAGVAQLSRQRIGQLADDIDPTELSPSRLRDQIHQVDEWPQDVMIALAGLAHPVERDDPARDATLYRQVSIVYGDQEAERRQAGRVAARTAYRTDPARRTQLDESSRRRHKTVYGTDQQN